MKFSWLSLIAILVSLNVYAARPCGAGGADPTVCKSHDGKYEIWLSQNRNVTGLGISTGAFCDYGYLKLDGQEINGAIESKPDDNAKYGLESVESVTSELGVEVNNDVLHKVMMPKTAIGFVLNADGMNMLANSQVDKSVYLGHVLAFSNNTALMYLYSDASAKGKTARLSQKQAINLTCE